MTRLLLVCSRNRLRSPTAERVFSTRPGLEAASAGTNRDSDVPLTGELVAWADVIFVMERIHARKLQQHFGRFMKSTRLICLDIPDHYDFMAPELVALLDRKVSRHLP